MSHRPRYAKGARQSRAHRRDGAVFTQRHKDDNQNNNNSLFAGKEKMQTKTKIILPPPRHADLSSREVNTSTLTFCLAAAGWTGRPDQHAAGQRRVITNGAAPRCAAASLLFRDPAATRARMRGAGKGWEKWPEGEERVCGAADVKMGSIGVELFWNGLTVYSYQANGNSVAGLLYMYMFMIIYELYRWDSGISSSCCPCRRRRCRRPSRPSRPRSS